MSPEDLAARHPRLYHLTEPDALPGILRHGLLPTQALLTLFEVAAADRRAIERQRRPASVRLDHPDHGRATITDNVPLHMAKLARCLDDGLAPEDWLRKLNERVFLWADQKGLAGLLSAKLNLTRDRQVLVLDTLSVARRCGARVELSPINSGSTLHVPARRGLSTFTPLERHSYKEWQWLRRKSGPDRVKEVTVVGSVPDVAEHLLEHYIVPGSHA